MDVRCAGCRGEVSEWAARCPLCGSSLDNAELISAIGPVDVTTLEPASVGAAAVDADTVDAVPAGVVLADRPWWPHPTWATRRRFGLTAVAVIAVGALALGVFAPHQGGPAAHKAQGGPNPGATPTSPLTTLRPSTSRPAHGSILRRIPAGLASELLFFAEPTRTGPYRADGATKAGLGAVGVGYPLEPLVSGRGVVVYIHGDYAYRTEPHNSTRVVRLGLATWIFPGGHGTIGIESGEHGGQTSVEYMAADGAFPDPDIRKLQLPPGITAVAQVPSGLIIASGAVLEELLNGVTRVQLSIIEAHSTINLGTASAVVGVSGATAALVICPDRLSADCALQLVNTTTRHVRTIRPPPGYTGFAPGGGFSPDGNLLATFVSSRSASGAPTLHVAVVHPNTGTASVIGSGLLAGSIPIGDATWSTDGHWLYFGGMTGRLDAEQITRTGPSGKTWTLPLSTSFAVVGD